MSTNSASKAVSRILEAFENSNIPKAIAYATFNPPANIPAYKWTRHNRALAFLQGTGDARGFRQWKDAGRHVKKGASAIFILGPVLKESGEIETKTNPDTGAVEEIKLKHAVGYHGIPVFRVEDTDGKSLEYLSLDVESLPFADIAKQWGIEVKAGAFNGSYYGYFSDQKKEIVLATTNDCVFLHELAHAAHYRVDPNAQKKEEWERELIAELSAAALCYMIGKEPNTGNHFRYISKYAEQKKLSPVKACMKILDVCLSVIDAITKEAGLGELKRAA